jgi:hypothetical protein
MYLCMYVCMCVYVCMGVCMYVCVCVCMFVCMCVCMGWYRKSGFNTYLLQVGLIHICMAYGIA